MTAPAGKRRGRWRHRRYGRVHRGVGHAIQGVMFLVSFGVAALAVVIPAWLMIRALIHLL